MSIIEKSDGQRRAKSELHAAVNDLVLRRASGELSRGEYEARLRALVSASRGPAGERAKRSAERREGRARPWLGENQSGDRLAGGGVALHEALARLVRQRASGRVSRSDYETVMLAVGHNWQYLDSLATTLADDAPELDGATVLPAHSQRRSGRVPADVSQAAITLDRREAQRRLLRGFLTRLQPDAEAAPGRAVPEQIAEPEADAEPIARRARTRFARLRALLRWVIATRSEIAVQVPLIAGVSVAHALNMLHWPALNFDEGTYMVQAWAVQAHGILAPYTYSYGHPPLGWIVISLWTWATNLFGPATYSVDGGREFMFVVGIVSTWLLYVLARRLGMGRTFAAVAVVLFALSPVAIYFQRLVLLDNLAVAWTLAAFVLALTPRHRLWAYAGSGACFAAAVLSKETILVLLPALMLLAAQHADQRTRRYCMTILGSFFALLLLAYPLYATLKGELVPGPGHVSLFGESILQLVTRTATGSALDPQSAAHGIVAFWLSLDPWVLGAALLLCPIAFVYRNTRAAALAFAIQVAIVFRPGYLPSMYVIGLLPFAALIVAGTADGFWRRHLRPWFVARAEPRHRVAPGRRTWRSLAYRATGWLPPARVSASALVLGLVSSVVIGLVAPAWGRTYQEAATTVADTPLRSAEEWLVQNISHHANLIVSDEIYLYLVQHGFDASPVSGGFYSRTVVSYWPLDYDPAVQRAFPDGWRDFDYIVSTQPMRDTPVLTPTATRAIAHSRLVIRFGQGRQAIEIRAIRQVYP